MNAIHKHIEEIAGGIFGTGSSLVVMAPTQEFITTVLTAFVCGVAGAIGGFLVKKITTRKKKS